MKDLFGRGSRDIVPIAETGDRFVDFMPYVASVNDRGVVAFQATLSGGGSGVYRGTGGPIAAAIEHGADAVVDIISHPDIDASGSACCYANLTRGGRSVILVRDGRISVLAEDCGPLGPAMNDQGTVAYRANPGSGASGVFTWSEGSIACIASTSGRFSAFHGLPVIDRRGAVAFRADLTAGGQAICVGDGGTLTTIAETGEVFSDLGRFPSTNEAGEVAFTATLQDGQMGVFVASEGRIATIIDTGERFESFRGALLDGVGRVVFYATPRGGSLGVFTGPDPVADQVISLGAPLFGSTVVDFALNPVSINGVGQLALRVRLADERQLVVRADPT